MTRPLTNRLTAAVLLAGALAWPACSSADGKAPDAATVAVLTAVSVAPTAAVEQPITRFIRATGSLMAEDHADVAAEIAGRIVATPIERGTAVNEGAVLVRVSPAEAEAQAREAEANAAQIEARLGITTGGTFDVNAVPEYRRPSPRTNLGAERVQPDQVAPRTAGRVAVRIRSAPLAA